MLARAIGEDASGRRVGDALLGLADEHQRAPHCAQRLDERRVVAALVAPAGDQDDLRASREPSSAAATEAPTLVPFESS